MSNESLTSLKETPRRVFNRITQDRGEILDAILNGSAIGFTFLYGLNTFRIALEASQNNDPLLATVAGVETVLLGTISGRISLGVHEIAMQQMCDLTPEEMQRYIA
ncbi:hypothetical protein HYS91_03370 [Candidatus Daviesbacteria bacterium]|nr:hypothetical protein [Candidatus Daviesbacteria bacterium]